jgi:hypothetical protein
MYSNVFREVIRIVIGGIAVGMGANDSALSAAESDLP